MTALLQIQNLRKAYGPLAVIHGISLDVSAGEVVAIIGASGSGKSTFLRCINLLEIPTGGEIIFDGQRVEYGGGRRQEKQLRILRSQIGMVFQAFNLWPHKTVLQNIIEAPIIVKGVAREEATKEAERFLERTGLSSKRDVYPSRLSGGQQQRVAIIRALAMKPKLMLFDEVTSSLDPELVGEVLELIATLAKDGMTMLAVTHEISFARSVSTRTIFIDKGVIAEEGPSKEMLTRPKEARTQQFLSRILHPSHASSPTQFDTGHTGSAGLLSGGVGAQFGSH